MRWQHRHPSTGVDQAQLVAKYTSDVDFDRGFIDSIKIEPYLFLEYGEFLFANAPIMSVEFLRPQEGPFPYRELAASPLLRRIVGLTFSIGPLPQMPLIELLSSPHLTSLLQVDSRFSRETSLNYPDVAAISTVRRLLSFHIADGFPGESLEESNAPTMWGGVRDSSGRSCRRQAPRSSNATATSRGCMAVTTRSRGRTRGGLWTTANFRSIRSAAAQRRLECV
jgi:hypothetical protein